MQALASLACNVRMHIIKRCFVVLYCIALAYDQYRRRWIRRVTNCVRAQHTMGYHKVNKANFLPCK